MSTNSTLSLIAKYCQLFRSDLNIVYLIDYFLQALDGALKQVKALSPETAAIFFSVDADLNKVVALAAVPKVIGFLLSNHDEFS